MVKARQLYPNDSGDHYGEQYPFDSLEEEWERAKMDNTSSIEVPKHIKINKQKDITKQKGDTIASEVNSGQTEPIQEAQASKEENKEYSEILENLKEEDISHDTSTGQKIYSTLEAGVKSVGESGGAIIKQASKSVAEGISEGIQLDEKYKDTKRIVEDRTEELIHRGEAQVDKIQATIDQQGEKLNETIKNIAYLSVGVVFAFLLLKK